MTGDSGATASDADAFAGRVRSLLPHFTRHVWVNGGARDLWAPRMVAIRRAWCEIEWRSVATGMRPCALVALSPQTLPAAKRHWMTLGLSAVGLPAGTGENRSGLIYAFVGDRRRIRLAEEAWTARDSDALGELFGYPECCRTFFRTTWVERQSVDTTWSMAARSAIPRAGVVEVDAGDSPVGNVLWRWVGVRAVPHLPCLFHCVESVRLGERLLALGEEAGFGGEVAWTREILSWPVEWSALHGIAEVKTPVLKISTRSDATAAKFIVRWRGTAYPAEGATGLRFPYRAARRRLVVSPEGAVQRRDREVAAARPSTILEATLDALPQEAVAARRIVRFRLTDYFTVVELDDGSVGAAMSYGPSSPPELEDRRTLLERARAHDPLLLGATSRAGDLVLLSLRVSIVSALTAPALLAGGDSQFTAGPSPPSRVFAGARSALVIGFGGYMDLLARMPSVRGLHVADLQYAARRDEMDAACARYRRLRPDLELTISDGSDTPRRLAAADLVCMSGSTLCNGSLEALLEAAGACAHVVVQGQSAAIHPGELFRRGVTLVSTTVKPRNLVDLADRNMLRSVLEGGIAPIYLTSATGGPRRSPARGGAAQRSANPR